MITLQVSNFQEFLDKLYSQKLLDLFANKEVELFNNVKVLLTGKIDFSVDVIDSKIVISLKNAKPQIRVGLKVILHYTGNVNSVVIEKNKLTINGDFPTVVLEAV